MKVTKLGHSCLLIEERDTRIITDPGVFTEESRIFDLRDISGILITHEHKDHCHVPYVREIVLKNPNAQIFSNKSVCEILSSEGIVSSALEEGEKVLVSDILIEGFGETHATIHKEIPSVRNVGFLIGEKLFFSGDAFVLPSRSVSVLALPIAAPWAKISEVVEYARSVAPKKCFPIHDAILARPEPFYGTAEKLLTEKGIEFFIPRVGEEFEV